MAPDTKAMLDKFFSAYPQREAKKGDFLIFAGEEPAGVFYLTQGSVKQYGVSAAGEEIVLNIFKAPSFFPMSYAINKAPNNYFYQAASDIEYAQAPAGRVVSFLKQNAKVTFDLIARLYRGLDGILERNFYLMEGSAYKRIIIELIIDGKRFGQKQADGSYILKVNQHELASRVGLSRETVSRDIKNVPYLKIMHGAIQISDLAALEKYLHELE